MHIGHVFVIVVGVGLQTVAATFLSGSPSVWFFYLLVIAVLWGIVVNVVRHKQRDLGSWLGGAFFFGPLITLVVLLFVPAQNINAPYLYEE